MILFNGGNLEFYNYIIHHFMEVDKLNEKEEGEKFLKEYIPKYLYKEQKDKCLKTLNEIFHRTNDVIEQNLNALYEVIIYGIIEKMNHKQKRLSNFNKKYFDEKANKMIEKIAKKEQKEDPLMSLKEIKEIYYDIYYYADDLFSDLDFLYIEDFFNKHDLGDDSLLKQMGINLEYYFEILPKDIRDRHKTGHCTLNGEIHGLLVFLNDEIENRDFYKLFWEEKNSATLTKIKIALDNIISAYFCNQPIDIAWDIKEYKDKIEIIFYKKREEEEKVLVYFTLVQEKLLNEKYLNVFNKIALNYNNAYFLFLTFNNKDYNNIKKYIDTYVYTKTIVSLLNIYIFDVRKKEAVSKLK